ncbi:unnamed protein product [Penicillium pancosmium]
MKPLLSSLARVQEENDNGSADTSLFFKLYEDYKKLDTEAQDTRRMYDVHYQTHTIFTRQMKAEAPDAYAGNPWATKEWHLKAAFLAEYARDKLKAVAKARRKFCVRYVGYDEYESAQGHKKRIENTGKAKNKLARKAKRHHAAASTLL